MIRELTKLLLKRVRIDEKWINKFTVTTVLFVFWIGLFDKHDLITRWKLASTIKEMEAEKLKLAELIEVARLEKIDLESNPEKYAREKFFMKTDKEDIFIISTDKK